MGINRFKVLVGQPFEGRVSTIELDKYGFGNVRSFKQYLEFFGVTFEQGKKDAESCEQRHWVPYSNATEVEEIVGGGWRLHGTTSQGSVQRSDEEMIGRLRQRVTGRVSMGTFNSLAPILFVLGAAVVFLVVSSNPISRKIRQRFRHKSQHNSSE